MEQQTFFIKGRLVAAEHASLQDALAVVHDTPERPRCMCVPGGVEMYVARHRHFVVKRMPGTGALHHPACVAFEPDHALSGLGQLIGDAIIEHAPDSIELRVDFPLSRTPGKSISRGEAETPAEIEAPRHLMSLRALMHYLFERAGFNRWTPAMEGKRSQAVLHKYLMEAADSIELKGSRLSERLYVPEQFSEDRKDAIAQRRRDKFSILHTQQDDAGFRMALVIGEYKAAEHASYGTRVWIRHMPDSTLVIETKAWQRIERAYGPLFEALAADTKTKHRLLLCALVFARREHMVQIDKASVMLTTENWIPLEGLHESALLQRLTEAKRRFLKPLRYDAKSAAAFCNALLLDTGDTPTPLHVLSGFMEAKERSEKEKMLKTIAPPPWVWHTDRDMPPLPPVASPKARP